MTVFRLNFPLFSCERNQFQIIHQKIRGIKVTLHVIHPEEQDSVERMKDG